MSIAHRPSSFASRAVRTAIAVRVAGGLVRRIGAPIAALGRSPSGRIVLALGAGYLLGTFPTADIVARRAGRDLRQEGSGNPGGANALQVIGPAAGLQVIGGDIAKGAIAGAVGGAIAGPTGAHLAGTAAVAGHCHPVWNGFRGGKGVAASAGQCLSTFPAYFPIDAAVAGLTAAVPVWKQRAFAATAVSSVCWVVAGTLWWRRGWRNAWGPRPTAMLPVSAALSSAIIIERFVTAGEANARSADTVGPDDVATGSAA